jgi:hypothetical protein
MPTVPAARPARKTSSKPVRKPRVLKPVTVALAGLAYDRTTGLGCVVLNGRFYTLEAVHDGPRTTGLAFGPLDGTDRVRHVDFTDEHGWRCDCEDATFNPGRPGGCKHVVSSRQVARSLKGGA